MNRVLLLFVVLGFIMLPVSASQFTAPEVFESGRHLMPEASTLGEGILMILEDVIPLIRPDLYEASRVCIAVIAAVMLCSIIRSYSEPVKRTSVIVCTAAVSSALFVNTNSLVRLAADTVTELCEYGKLLLPVMTGAMAAHGAVGTSAALYAGTTVFIGIAGSLIGRILIPFVFIFLAMSVASAVSEQEMVGKIRDLLNTFICWSLKTVLTVFISYMGITGVISGTVDAAALKTTKAAISFAIPVVGSVLSDASEAVLISASLAKNAAGLYGIFAVAAMFLGPVIRIGSHYLMLKLTSIICSVFGNKETTAVISGFASAMGMLMGMTGTVCLLLLIGTVCFLKGAA